MPYSIITHSGKAHIDEMLAAAVIAVHLGELPGEIRRIESNNVADMVANNSIPENAWILDCGLVYDPQRRLYDHHQNRNLPSTALMVFNHYFPDLKGTDLHAYFQLVSKVDTCGAQSLKDASLVSESRDYWCFPQQILTKIFESDPRAVLNIMTQGLAAKIDYEGVKVAAAEWVAVPGRLTVENIGGVCVLAYAEAPPEKIFDGLHGIDRDIVKSHDACVIYGYDKKDPGIRTLYRTEIGQDAVDFTRSSPAEVIFNHQGGFLMKFRPASEDEWHRLVAESRI